MKTLLLASIATAALLAGNAAHANIITTTFNSGYVYNYTASIAGTSLNLTMTNPPGQEIYLYTYSHSMTTDTWTLTNYDLKTTKFDTVLSGSAGLQFTGNGLLAAGTMIDQSDTFSSGPEVVLDIAPYYLVTDHTYTDNYGYTVYYSSFSLYTNYLSGPFLTSSPVIGYLGLSLNIGGAAYYGWAELGLDGANDQMVDVIALAYETSANTGIKAGALVNPATVPEPWSLALFGTTLLGLGAVVRGRTA